MPNDKRRIVTLPNHGRFWFLEDDYGEGPLAPLNHCDDEGHLNMFDGLCSDSYAHVFASGEIKRYLKVIGHKDDLIEERIPT